MEEITTVQVIDGELGVMFPDEVLKRMSVGEGDTLSVVVVAGGLMLTRADLVSSARERSEGDPPSSVPG